MLSGYREFTLCKQGVTGSIPVTSTIFFNCLSMSGLPANESRPHGCPHGQSSLEWTISVTIRRLCFSRVRSVFLRTRPCLQRLVARRINKLHQVRWNAMDCYKSPRAFLLHGWPDSPACIHRSASTSAAFFRHASWRSRSRSSKRDSHAPAAAARTTRRSATTAPVAAVSAALSAPPAARCAVPDPCPPASHHVATAP